MPDPIHRPPRLVAWLFERLLSPEYDAVLGDLEEDYHDRADDYGPRRAALRYGLDGLRTAPALFVHNLLWHHIMLKNYLVIAFRNLRKHKGFASINILGLAVSMSVCLLVITLVRDQKSYDTFHEKADRIYRVIAEIEEPYGRFSMATSPGPVAPALLAQHPGVEKAVRFSGLGGHATYGDQTFDLAGLYAEPTFFEIFDFVLAEGDERTALAAPYTLVLTRKTATKFFGEADPMGQVIERDGIGAFTVTGILEDLPHNSHFAFEALASFATVEARQAGGVELNLDNWNIASRFYNYLLLAEGASAADVEVLAADLAARNHTDESKPIPELRLQALTRINLGAELSNQHGHTMPAMDAYILAAFGFILILIAVFNYISLSVSRSLKRAREIGIRKVVGAHRGQIVRQFLSEAVIVALLALVLAVGLLAGLVPGFNNLHGFQEDLDMGRVTIDLARDGGLFALFVLFAVGVGVVAGLYPAFKMSSYVPTRVLKGLTRVEGFSGLTLRKVLIVGQFSLSIVVVITTLVIYRQFGFLMEADYGFGESQLVNVELQGVDYETLRNELMRLPDVVAVAATSSPPTSGSKTWTDIQAEGMDEPILIQFYSIDEAFLDQYRLKLVAGRDFSEAFSTGEEEPILLTKKALPALGLGTPHEAVGKVVTFDTFPDVQNAIIIGVVDDLYARGYEKGYVPVVLRHLPERYRYAAVRIRPGNIPRTIAQLETTWKQLAPTITLRYGFYDDQLLQRYVFLQDMLKLFGALAGFIIFIACLGLLGMASYTAETRVKEVGIRKVLGADVRSMVVLLSGDYVKLLAVAVVIATPLAWLLNNALLQTFANRVDLGVWVFAVGILPILLLALLTIGSQTIKAGLTNPVETLRHE